MSSWKQQLRVNQKDEYYSLYTHPYFGLIANDLRNINDTKQSI